MSAVTQAHESMTNRSFWMVLPALIFMSLPTLAIAEVQVICPPHEGDFATEPVILDTDTNKASRIHNQQTRAVARQACVRCGNGIPEAGEQCDTGGETAGCDVDCTPVACGDGIVNNTAGEFCDDGNEVSGDGCSASCLPEQAIFCGNGIIDAGEQCDDGNSVDIDFCTNDCTNAVCGDTLVCTECNEECDTGGSSATCDSDCTAPLCGDGLVNISAGEECDDGNVSNGDGCESDCTFSPGAFCSDGEVRTCGTDVGACVSGTETCANNSWGVCEGATDPVPEICGDNIDQDCNGHADDGLCAGGIDVDGDGFAGCSNGICGSDCDDFDASVWPGAPELCDGQDNDCDTVIDEGC